MLIQPSEKQGRIDISVMNPEGRIVFELQPQVRLGAASILSASDDPNAIILSFRDGLRHPAGDQSGLSWFNAEGKGFLRVIDPKRHQLVLLPLLGLMPLPDAPIEPRQGSRGPSRSADLWMMAVAMCLPRGFSVGKMIGLTGLSESVVRQRLADLSSLGLLAASMRDRAGRDYRYAVPFTDAEARLTSFMQERWTSWKSGTGTAHLRPTFRYFRAMVEWPVLLPQLRKAGIVSCFASGVTALEGGTEPGDRRWVQPSGLLPELYLYIGQDQVDALVHMLGATMHEESQDHGSTLCVLAQGHPALRLFDHRSRIGSYLPVWPVGLASWDARNHHDPRVSQQAAPEAWMWWLANQATEQDKEPGEDRP